MADTSQICVFTDNELEFLRSEKKIYLSLPAGCCWSPPHPLLFSCSGPALPHSRRVERTSPEMEGWATEEEPVIKKRKN